jgi:plasmid stability protein
MAELTISNIPLPTYQRLRQLAAAHDRSEEHEALAILQEALAEVPARGSQADLLAELLRRSFVPPPGTPDSVELLREDRGR